MSSSPLALSPNQLISASRVRKAWVPVVLSIMFVCFTSTTLMSGYHTQIALTDVWKAVLGPWHLGEIGSANLIFRKVGHFIGYGLIGLLFRRGWYTTIRSRVLAMSGSVMLLMASLAVLSTFVLASLDEWHQCYLPQRVGSFHDVLLDTGGAMLFNILFLMFFNLRRGQRLLSLGLTQTSR